MIIKTFPTVLIVDRFSTLNLDIGA